MFFKCLFDSYVVAHFLFIETTSETSCSEDVKWIGVLLFTTFFNTYLLHLLHLLRYLFLDHHLLRLDLLRQESHLQ